MCADCRADVETSKVMANRSVIKTVPEEEEEESSSLHDSLGERTTTTAIGKVSEFWTFSEVLAVALMS